ncbi:hypothetical protein [Candidatus Erwinia dacicola]|uniref:Putative transmembrane protein n=1 Tax=Candidatus Erwinia dacicola TaxID=252393 RepID=A0A1E7Z2H9_9GAMM|nr:hypothetical protein [Candidatus Erwinia dacicola]OFC62972.1 hypothetical protein BBW68_07270 [Candidatus Erwinia dacicola]RAP72101.1 putative transmembrane protein [Candidatus Erwinia dacicola]
MTVNSTGEQNRIAGRDFNENKIRIDQFDGRNTINVSLPEKEVDKRLLVKAQRKELNSLVTAIADADAGDNEAFIVWQKVHAEIGVTCIGDMTVNQYRTTVSYLQAMLDRCKEKDASKALVSLLLRNSQDSEIRQKLIRYCHINFGTGRLNDLTRPQLQLALSWLDQHSHDDDQSTALPTITRLNFVTLLRTYPIVIYGAFIVGFIAGALIFLIDKDI